MTAIATAVAAYQTLVERGALPEWAPLLTLSDGPLELTSFALALLLVFRTDSSYGRWNESLNMWSDVRNISKDIVREAVCWIKDPRLVGMLVRWTLTFSRSLKVYLRQGASIETEIETLLLPHEKARMCDSCVDTSLAYPQYTLHVLTQAVERAGLTEIREDRLLSSISRLNAAIGLCEKLIRYPIPLSYTRHTSRFMIIWLTFLPVALWDDCQWLTIPITTITSFLLLGIEEIGVQIEEPFSTLPLEDFCKDIEKDLWSIAESRLEVTSQVDFALQHTINMPGVATRDGAMAAATGQPMPGASSVQIDVAAMLAAFASTPGFGEDAPASTSTSGAASPAEAAGSTLPGVASGEAGSGSAPHRRGRQGEGEPAAPGFATVSMNGNGTEGTT